MTHSKQNKILPQNPVSAVQMLIKTSRTLVNLAEKETQALIQKDMLAFAIIQHEKEKLAEHYTEASEEFRSRIEEFRSVEKNLLVQLESLQGTLAEKTHANNVLVENIKSRAERSKQKTLLAAQEFMQNQNRIQQKGA